jgi:gliding motility-associated-like protein
MASRFLKLQLVGRLAGFIFWICISTGDSLYAQLCTGSLGDPVVNITFGTPGNTGGFTATSAYQFWPTPCPNDGYYTITSSTSNCFGGAWHTVSRDHTGNPNGAFFLVNASFTPGDFFLTNVKGLCPNTQYEFASWMINVLRNPGIKPNIRFSIETTAGAVIQQYITGDIPETTNPEWKQYGFYFTTPPGVTEVVLRLTNNAPGGIGNDIGLDDITFRACGPDINIVEPGGADSIVACATDAGPITLSATVSSGFLNPVYQWQQSLDSAITWNDISGATSLTFTVNPSAPGRYLYRMINAESGNENNAGCRIASKPYLYKIVPPPLVNAGPDRSLVRGDTLQMNATAGNEVVGYQWIPPENLTDANSLNPRAYPLEDQIYTLQVISDIGCTAQDAMTITIIAGLYIPTAFSPNNDGLNDTWRIPFIDSESKATLTIYNRFGQQVYRAQNSRVAWDGNFKGKPQPSGTYLFHLQYSGSDKPIKGSLMLVR